MAYQDEAKVSAALADLEAAPFEEPLRATVQMLRKLTREHTVNADDMRAVLAGASREQIEDALAVCFTFNTGDRLPYVRVGRGRSQSLRDWCEVFARARLPMTPAVGG